MSIETLKKPGPIALKAVEVAEGFAAAHTHEEGGNNHGEEIEKMLKLVGCKPGDPWCAAFVRFCIFKAFGFLKDAGQPGLAIPADFPCDGYVPDYAAWAKQHGLWIPCSEVEFGKAVPERGDLACFYFAAKGRVAHVGIVRRVIVEGTTNRSTDGHIDWDVSHVETVEGNTSAPDGLDRDGDGVYVKRRELSELGYLGGFIRLPF